MIYYYTDVFTDLCADDKTLYGIQTSQETIIQNLQSALNQLHIWYKSNGMLLNAAKASYAGHNYSRMSKIEYWQPLTSLPG